MTKKQKAYQEHEATRAKIKGVSADTCAMCPCGMNTTTGASKLCLELAKPVTLQETTCSDMI